MAKQFTDDAARRIVRATAEVEQRVRNRPSQRGRWQGGGGGGGGGYVVWPFELLEALPEGVENHPVLARRRWYSGGSLVTSTDAADNCYVADYYEVGFCGAIGAVGGGEYRNSGMPGKPLTYNDGVNGDFPLLAIVNLNCPSGQTVDCSDFEEGSGS